MLEDKAQFLAFFSTAMNAQKQLIEEAWVVWEQKPAQEIYPNGFKDFLLEYIDREVGKEYKKAGIAQSRK